jgi:hypothetical protein
MLDVTHALLIATSRICDGAATASIALGLSWKVSQGSLRLIAAERGILETSRQLLRMNTVEASHDGFTIPRLGRILARLNATLSPFKIPMHHITRLAIVLDHLLM